MRSRDASAAVRLSVPLRPSLPAHRFRARAGFQPARSPSPPFATLRAFHARRRLALLWIRLPPIDFCNYNFFFQCVGTPTSTRFSQVAQSSARWRFPELALVSISVSPPTDFPSRRSLREPRAATTLTDDASPALQARRKVRLRKLPASPDVACGRRPSPTIACGDGCWTAALGCTGRGASSEGPSSRIPCCRRECG